MIHWYVKKVTSEGTLIEKWTAPINQLTDRDLEDVRQACAEEQCKRANEASKKEGKK